MRKISRPFVAYSNDFHTLCTEDEYILYADDTCLENIGDDLDILVQQINQKVSIALDYLKRRNIPKYTSLPNLTLLSAL